MVLADVDFARAQQSAQALTSDGFHATAVKCDVRSKVEVEALMQMAVTTYGGLDVMVANAGGHLGAMQPAWCELQVDYACRCACN